VVSITDDDAAAMLHDIADRRGKRSMANQTKHIIHAMFKWAKQPGRKFVTVNPFADLPAPGGAIVKRDRFLSSAEIRQVWSALDEPERFNVSRDVATALRLITTAARPGMVAGMVGGELRDLRGPSEHGPHWALPAERMKAGSAFITPLSGLALERLRPHLKSDPESRLFKLAGRNQLHGRIVAGLAMERWTPHDLRRTAATILDRSGYSLEQIGALLAHTRKGGTAVYARWDKFDLRREMATVVERSLRTMLDGEPTAAIRTHRRATAETTKGRPCAVLFSLSGPSLVHRSRASPARRRMPSRFESTRQFPVTSGKFPRITPSPPSGRAPGAAQIPSFE
jgi:integrase